jgi:SAM-dependent methyltransferase
LFAIRERGYCPRCNSKARHRRLWLYLERNTNLFADPLRVLHVSPNYSLARRFSRLDNLDYVTVDLHERAYVSTRMDLTAIPLRSGSFDGIVCIHVLEEIPEDRKAMAELFRVLKPGGWAVITTPIWLDRKTFEEPTITEPEERLKAFGESAHVRIYGYDLAERLESVGLHVTLNRGTDVEARIRQRYGLRDDEHIFHCTR